MGAPSPDVTPQEATRNQACSRSTSSPNGSDRAHRAVLHDQGTGTPAPAAGALGLLLHHVARLELVRALQDHGFTLSAIKGYIDRIPDDATPSDIALHLSLLAPVTGEREVDVAEGLATLGVPAEAASAVASVYERHGQEVAAELSEIVRHARVARRPRRRRQRRGPAAARAPVPSRSPSPGW